MTPFHVKHSVRDIVPVINHYDYLAFLRLGDEVSNKRFRDVSLNLRNLGENDADIQIQILDLDDNDSPPDKLHDSDSTISLADGTDQRNVVSVDTNERLLEDLTFKDPDYSSISGATLTTIDGGGDNPRKSFKVKPGGVVSVRFNTVGSLVLIRREIPDGAPATDNAVITRLLIEGSCNDEITFHLIDSEKNRFKDSEVKYS